MQTLPENGPLAYYCFWARNGQQLPKVARHTMNVPLTPLMFLRRSVKLYPDKTAVVCGARRFSYRQFSRRIHRLSRLLVSLGVKPGTVVAYLSRNGHRLLEAYYGVVQTGAIFLPLNVRLTAEDFRYILNHSEARLLLLEEEFLPLIGEVRGELPRINRFLLLDGEPRLPWIHPLGYEQAIEECSPDPFPDAIQEEDSVAELFYTSGTTARPKGVMLTHRNLYLHALSVVFALQNRETDVQLHTIPLFHANGWGATHSITCVGGTHVMLRHFRPRTVLELIRNEGVTTLNLVPTMAALLLNSQAIPNYRHDSLRLIHLGGSSVPPEMVRQLEAAFGCECSCGYGLTETSPVLTVSLPKSHLREEGEARLRRAAMTGLELPGSEVRVIDRHGREVAADGQTVGEIVARSNVVMKGYWKQPEETARVLKQGWFHTGDLATVDSEGYLMIVDRKKDIIVRGGENISSIEIEKTLFAHPDVLECAVIAVPDPKWGESPRALVVPREGTELSEQALKQYCRQKLAAYKVPSGVEFLNSLPKGGTGKIQKKALRERYLRNNGKRIPQGE